jgi:hypothetical protein
MKEDPNIQAARGDVIDNLEALQTMLEECVDAGMMDLEDAHYNELLDLIEDAHISKTWDDFLEIIARAKSIEEDIDAWGSMHGRSSISLVWPHRPLGSD